MLTGTVVAERFEVLGRAGAGGAAVVYRARDLGSQDVVALKVLHAADGRDVARFQREIEALAALADSGHDGLVACHAHGLLPDGRPWLAMDWLEGVTLAERLAEGPRPAAADAVALAHRVGGALAVAHAAGLVHRDVKPSNIFLPGGDLTRAKLLDFGLVRRGDTSLRLTMTGQIVGTPIYMAPEQARGDAVFDARVDVFALGCVLFECLVGRPAFQAPSILAVLARILFEPSPRPADCGAVLPPELDALVASMLAKYPDERPRDAADVVRRLEAVGSLRRSDRLSSRRVTPALTPRERRLVSLIAGRAADGRPRPPLSALRLTAAPFGVEVEALLDGSLVALVTGGGTPAEHAAIAARCALAIALEAGDALALALATGWGVVHGSGEPVGPVIARAAALLARARPGHLAVDPPTAALLRADFEVAPAPGGSWLELSGQRDVRSRASDDVPFVGRERELTVLRETLLAATDTPRAAAVLVTGPPGVGKSRLADAFVQEVAAADREITVYRSRRTVDAAYRAFALLAGALGEHAREALPSVRESRAIDRTTTVDHAADRAQAQSDRLRAAFVGWLDRQCRRGPVLLVLDGLERADRPTLQLLDLTLRRLGEAPLMVLGLGRPELEERHPTLWRERDLTRLQLRGLRRPDAVALVTRTLGPEAPHQDRVGAIVDRGAGNPYFLAELARHGGADQLPDNVLGMIQARLGRLDQAARLVLRAVSIFGDHAPRAGISHLLGDAPGALSPVDDLLQAGWLSDDGGLGFVRDLVRDAAYATLTADDRKTGHALAGDWLEARPGAAPARLADHFERAGLPARAAPWFALAAREAMDVHDLETALALVERGLECDPAAEVRAELQLVMAIVMRWRARPEALEAATAARDGSVPGTPLWFEALGERCIALNRAGRGDDVEAEVDRLVASWPADEDARPVHAMALHRAAVALGSTGRFARAAALQRTLESSCGELIAADPMLGARFYRLDAYLMAQRGELLAALDAYARAAELFEQAGDKANAAVQWASYGYRLTGVGQLEEAERLLRRSLAAALEVGAAVPTGIALQNLGHVAALRGRPEEALGHLDRAIRLAAERTYPKLEAAARRDRAEALADLGDLEAALAEIAVSLKVVEGFDSLRAAVLGTAARLHLTAGSVDAALAAAADGMATLQRLGGIEEREFTLRLAWTEALRASGDESAALVALEEARARLLAEAETLAGSPLYDGYLRDVRDHARLLALTASGGRP